MHLAGKEGPGEICAVTHGFTICEKIPLNPPLLKGGNNASFLARVVHFIVKRIGGEMKIIIDKDKCKGHNNCISIAPNVFEVDEKFKAFVLDLSLIHI